MLKLLYEAKGMRESHHNSRKEEILHTLESRKQGMTAVQISELLGVARSNVSRHLNELAKERRIKRSSIGR